MYWGAILNYRKFYHYIHCSAIKKIIVVRQSRKLLFTWDFFSSRYFYLQISKSFKNYKWKTDSFGIVLFRERNLFAINWYLIFLSCRTTHCFDCPKDSNVEEDASKASRLQRIFLFFQGNGMGVKQELQFHRQPDSDFRFYMTFTLIIFAFLATIQGILLSG